MDIGATRSVIGRKQAAAYARLTRSDAPLAAAKPANFMFGGVIAPSVGTIDVRVPIAPDYYAPMTVDVVELDVPFLFGLDALDAFGVYVNNLENSLKCDRRGFATALCRKDNHLYLEWGESIHYTLGELDRLHKHFNHPQPDKLAAVLRRAGDPNAEPSTRSQLDKLTEACDVCQRLARAPGRFRVALPSDDIVFNAVVLIDIMYLNGRTLIHVVDKDTNFSAAGFTRGERIEELWQLYLDVWVHKYVGHPQVMHADHAPQFESPIWRGLLASAGTELVLSGIESHNALGVGERYHSFLRSVYRRVKLTHPAMPEDVALATTVAAMNQTAGPSGLIPTLLVFGVIPRMPVAPLPLPAQRDRMQAVVTARKEMQTEAAKARVRVALRAPVPSASSRDLRPGEQVLLFREKPPIGEDTFPHWIGPYTVVAQQAKVVWLIVDGELKQFSVDKVKRFHPPLTMPTDGDLHKATAAPATGTQTDAGRQEGGGAAVGESAPGTPTAVPSTASPPSPGGNQDYGKLLDAVIAGEQLVAKVHSVSNALVDKLKADERLPAFLTETIPQDDPRLKTAKFQAAARKEVDGLLERGTFIQVREGDVPRGANVIGGRFVYTVKNVDTKDEEAKARFVAQGHRDKAKWYVVHNLATLRQRSTRLLTSTSAVMGFRLFSHDITQAYLQSKDQFTRQLYLRPRREDMHLFDLAEGKLFKINLPLYGVCDAGDYWYVTFTAHIEQDLAMTPLTSDPALYYKRNPGGTLSGLLGAYVDDAFMGGDASFQTLTNKTLDRFQAKERKLDNTEFVGVRVSTSTGKAHHFTLDQVAYTDKLTMLPADATFQTYISARAKVAWLVHTRPDLSCGVNQAAQVTEEMFGPDAISALNALVKKAQAGRELMLSYSPLDRSTLRLRAYADSSFANNADQSSQLGFIVLLCDGSGAAHVLSYASRKCKRVVRSVMAGEVYAFSEALDEAFVIRYDLERLYNQHIPLTILTDSKQLFDVVTKASQPTEKRLMIDIAAARQAYTRHDISNVALIASDDNVADAFTKVNASSALTNLLRTGYDHTPVIQWVLRPPATKRSPGLEPPVLDHGTPGTVSHVPPARNVATGCKAGPDRHS